MNHFTISDIETLTGIKAHTLRIWEQRYQFCPGKRLFYYLLRLTEIKKDLKILISGPAISNEFCRIPAGMKKLHSITEVMHYVRQ